MKCINCGVELPDNAKFCANCGVKVLVISDTSAVTADEGKELVTDNQEIASKSNHIDDTENVEQTDVEILDNVKNVDLPEANKNDFLELWKKLDLFDKVALFGAVVSAILSLIALCLGRKMGLFFSFSQVAGFVVAFLMHRKVIKLSAEKSGMKYFVLLGAFSLLLFYILSFSWGKTDDNSNDIQIPTDQVTQTSENNPDISETTTESATDATEEYTIDYPDAASFESALNEGEIVKDKIVQFQVKEYKPESAIGVNCWAGEHLNFVSKNELPVRKGDIVVGRITEEPTTILDCWKVPYEVLDIKSGASSAPIDQNENTGSDSEVIESVLTEPSTTEPPTTEPPATENTVTEPALIVMELDSAAYVGRNPQDVEKELKDVGFENVKLVESVTTDTSKTDGTIDSVTIASASFSKGDSFEQDAEVIITYLKVEPAGPVFYSVTDYETVKRGDTGVFSYCHSSGAYDVYWVIDFDDGYVYWFADSKSEEVCDKVRIVSGTLNDRVTITWDDNGDRYSWYLYFQSMNQPEMLVIEDHNGVSLEHVPTDLENALRLRDTKKVVDDSDDSVVNTDGPTNPVFYSTNDYETAKKGNTGVFSYVDYGGSYDIYWIIDFDEGYVYYFTDGSGEDFCDRLEIESGDLNSNITVTYHDGGAEWSYKLHFKYVNHPETLIMFDQNGFDWEYTTADLDDALALRDTKRIKDY